MLRGTLPQITPINRNKEVSITNQILQDTVTAQKAKDTTRLNTLRGLKNAMSNARLAKGNINSELSEAEVLQIIRKQVAQRADSIQQYAEHGAADKAMAESVEKAILEEYLPAALSDEKIDELVTAAIATSGAIYIKDMGAVMKVLKETTGGVVDGKVLSDLVRSKLSNASPM